MKFICGLCKQEFKQLSELFLHYGLTHKPKSPEVIDVCPTCGQPIIELIAEAKIN